MYIPFYGKASDFSLELLWGANCNTTIKKIVVETDKIPFNENLNSFYDETLNGANIFNGTHKGQII